MRVYPSVLYAQAIDRSSSRYANSHTYSIDIVILHTAELVLSVTDECPNPKHKYEVLEWRDHNVIFGGQFAID
jgi:hypothetical protein